MYWYYISNVLSKSGRYTNSYPDDLDKPYYFKHYSCNPYKCLFTLDPAGLKRLVNLLRSLFLRPSVMVPCGLTEEDRVCGMGVMSSMDRLIPLRLRRLPTYRTEYSTVTNRNHILHKIIGNFQSLSF